MSEEQNTSEMLANRLRKNLRSLGRWARQQGHECYRLYDADIPEFSFAVDIYGEYAHLQEYKAPASIDADLASLRRNLTINTVREVLQIEPAKLVVKTRERQRGSKQYEASASAGEFLTLREGSARFLVNLRDYLDTGLFLDHRPIRRYIAKHSEGKRFLNLFSYTSSASVHAALGGASSTLSVDLSNTYLDWSRKNFNLNGIGGKNHRLKQADCLDFLAAKAKKGQALFDLIFLDPPTFSNSKKMASVLDTQRDHAALIHNAMALLAKDGLLIFSTNKRRFKLDDDLFQSYQVTDFTKRSLDKDFQRKSAIHHTFLIRPITS